MTAYIISRVCFTELVKQGIFVEESH